MAFGRTIVAPLPQCSESELLELHRVGDTEAFEEVYTRHASMVYALAMRMCGDPSRAQDLTQEVFLKVFRSLGRFRGRSSLKTWIYRVTLNHCRSRLGRRRIETESFEAEDLERRAVDPGRGPESRSLAADAERAVQAALCALPGRFREAVILRDLEELSYREIAEILGVRVGTVRSRIARGRDRLRAELEKES